MLYSDVNNFLNALEKDAGIMVNDVVKVCDALGLDFINGLDYLDNCFKKAGIIIQTGEDIISITNPTLAKTIFAITQISGAINAIINIFSTVTQAGLTTEDLTAVQADVKDLKTVWNSQISSILNSYTSVIKDITVIKKDL